MKTNSLILRIVFLGILDIFAIQIAVALGREISIFLGIGIIIFTVIVNIVFLSEKLFPWRWLMPAHQLPAANRQRPHFVADLYRRHSAH